MDKHPPLNELLDRATPGPEDREADWQAVLSRARRGRRYALWIGLGAAGFAAAMALLLVRPPPETPEPPPAAPQTGELIFRLADVPGAVPIHITFSYPPEATP